LELGIELLASFHCNAGFKAAAGRVVRLRAHTQPEPFPYPELFELSNTQQNWTPTLNPNTGRIWDGLRQLRGNCNKYYPLQVIPETQEPIICRFQTDIRNLPDWPTSISGAACYQRHTCTSHRRCCRQDRNLSTSRLFVVESLLRDFDKMET